MGVYTLFTILLLNSLIISQVRSQKLCKFRNSVIAPTKDWSFIENFSTRRCLKVQNFGHFPDRKIFLDECSYWTTPLREQKVYVENNTLGGFSLQVDSGMNERYCVTTKGDILHNAECRGKSFDQTWNLKPVRGQVNQYLIEQYSSRKCLIPLTLRPKSPVGLAPCNAFETEQIWKICTSSS